MCRSTWFEQHLIVARGSIAGLRDLNLLVDTGTIPSVRGPQNRRQASAARPTVRIRRFWSEYPDRHCNPLRSADWTVRAGRRTRRHRRPVLSARDPRSMRSLDSTCSPGRASASTTRRTRCRSRPADRESAQAPLKIVWPFLTVRLFIAGHPMQLLVDTGSRDLVLFKSRMPAALLPAALEGRKDRPARIWPAHLLRYELRQVTFGDQRWDTLPGFVLDASHRRYPPGIDGMLGVLALGGTPRAVRLRAWTSSAGASRSLCAGRRRATRCYHRPPFHQSRACAARLSDWRGPITSSRRSTA